MTNINNNPTSSRVSLQTSVARQTPNTQFGNVLATGAGHAVTTLGSAASFAAPYVPGGAIVSAAVSSMGAVGSSLKNSGGSQTSLGSTSSTATSSSPGSQSLTQNSSAFSAVEKSAAGGDSQAQMMMATKEMQEMNMSFNLQYLGIQQKMQTESRQFTLLSNIMKTKHDTAKNSISNVR